MTLMESWNRLLKLAYKRGTLPVILLAFFCGQGWDALRLVQGYAETVGVVTHYSCAKVVAVQFTYIVDDVARQGSSTNALSGFECPQYNPGETVRIFYSTRHPESTLMNIAPWQVLWHQFFVILSILLLFPFVTFFAAYRKWSNDNSPITP